MLDQQHELIGDIQASYTDNSCLVTFTTRVLNPKGSYSKVLLTIKPRKHVCNRSGYGCESRYHYGEFALFRPASETDDGKPQESYLCRFFEEPPRSFGILAATLGR